MHLIPIAVAVLAISCLPALAGEPKSIQVFKGACTDQSHIAEGPVGADLTQLQSRFICDTMVANSFTDNPNHVMFSFLQAKSNHARQIAFTGLKTDKVMTNVGAVYLETNKRTPIDEGACKFFETNGVRTSIVCMAKVDEGGQRTVAVVGFDIAKGQTKNVDLDWPQIATEMPGFTPYDRRGVANCSLPGTVIEFALLGDGQAKVARIESNYAPFRKAARNHPVWHAAFGTKDGKQLLVLDNGANTRIFVDIKEGRGMAYSGEGSGGASDILCQILVNP